VTNDPRFQAKVAAQALRVVPELVEKNASLETELAQYKRKERLDKIANLLLEKGQIGEHEVALKVAELSKLSEDHLYRIECGLEVVGPNGNIKLGEVEETVEGPDGIGQMTGLEKLLLTGE
jgi:hypothetical protein